MTAKAAASIVAERLGSALNFPRRSKPASRGEDFGIALSQARSAERRSNSTSERAEEKATPKPRKAEKPAPERDEQDVVDDSAGAFAQDKAAQPAEDSAVTNSDAPVPSESGSESANETVNADESETTESPVNENDGSSSPAEGTQEGDAESSGSADNAQAGPAEGAVSPDVLLLKALEVGVNAGEALNNISNEKPVQQEQSPAQVAGPTENTAQVTFDQNASTNNAGSKQGQDQTNQGTDSQNQRTGQAGQVQQNDVTAALNADSDNQQNAESAANNSQQTEPSPQISLQDIKAKIVESSGPQQVKSEEKLQDSSGPVTQASAAREDSNVPREFNLANELAKSLLPEQSEQSSGSTQSSSASSGQGETSSNPTGQNVGGGVAAPQGVRVIANSGAAPSAPAAFAVEATGDKGTIEQIVRVTQASTNQQASHVRLQLDPPELGQLRIDVKAHQGTLSLQIEADTQAAKTILESRMGELRNALQREGIHVERFDIEVKNTQQSQNEDPRDKTSEGNNFGREANRQDQANERSGGRRGAGAEDDLSGADHADGVRFNETESDAGSEQLVLSGFDVTA